VQRSHRRRERAGRHACGNAITHVRRQPARQHRRHRPAQADEPDHACKAELKAGVEQRQRLQQQDDQGGGGQHRERLGGPLQLQRRQQQPGLKQRAQRGVRRAEEEYVRGGQQQGQPPAAAAWQTEPRRQEEHAAGNEPHVHARDGQQVHQPGGHPPGPRLLRQAGLLRQQQRLRHAPPMWQQQTQPRLLRHAKAVEPRRASSGSFRMAGNRIHDDGARVRRRPRPAAAVSIRQPPAMDRDDDARPRRFVEGRLVPR
jgi:hypothetical protein